MGSATPPADISVTVLTISDRSFTGEREDLSGPAAAAALRRAGYSVTGITVVPDGRKPVGEAIEAAIDAGADVVLTLGGTGVGSRDETPEATRPLIQIELPGIAEGLRVAGARKIATATLSRGLAGVSRPSATGHRAVIVNLPGSVGGSRDGAGFLAPILPHVIDQLKGGDH